MDTITQIIQSLGTLIPVMLVVGAGWKWLPGLQKATNSVIPLLNSIVGLLLAFGGGASVAHASFFGDILHGASAGLGGPEKIVAVGLSVIFSMLFHDKVVKPVTPPSPATK